MSELTKDELDTAKAAMQLSKLPDEQRAQIVELIESVFNGDTKDFHLTDNGAPRVALAKYEASTARLSAEECAERLERMEIRIAFDMTPDDCDGYIVSKGWTLKGLRYEVARQMFLDSIMYSGEDTRHLGRRLAMRNERVNAVEDRWTVCKSKLAFVAAICKVEAQHVSMANNPNEGFHGDADALWGRHFVLKEVFDEMTEAIEGDMPELQEVKA